MSGNTAIVVGAGIGGLTTAYALQSSGWQVTVYERAPAIAPVGAGVGIAPNAVKALDHLGLGAALRERGQRQEALEIRLEKGARVGHIPAEGVERRYGAPFYALHRAELHRLLLAGLQPGTLRVGRRAEKVTTDAGQATVVLRALDGVVAESADLVVAADGVNSALRAQLFPGYPGPAFAGYTVWRGFAPARSLNVPRVLSETWGSGGARFGHAAVNDGQIYWFAAETIAEHARPAHDLARLAARFRNWHEPIPAMLAASPPETLLRHDVYYLRERLPSFVHGRVVLLGDAAHAVTPDIGQGACLAVEDAVTLAAAIGERGIDGGLRAYDRLRRPRTESMARLSGRLGHILQTASPTAALLRNTITAALPTPLLMKAVGGALAWNPPYGTATTGGRHIRGPVSD
ncbi:FAD-dependent monooxygenase [Nonomuraea sp. NPDC059023]|uniref:FAD-dependent monooxygenase n=1 Tax=unclassified Nonomuraea TaxID=2593643 RepID=UPI00368E334D